MEKVMKLNLWNDCKLLGTNYIGWRGLLNSRLQAGHLFHDISSFKYNDEIEIYESM